MFVDSAKIYVKAGKGGPGAISFRREKYVPKGGPDGGDGGRGGNVYIIGNKHFRTLISFKYRRKFVAQNGKPGEGALKTGASGKDLFINVPLGTLVYNDVTNELIADITEDGQKILVAKGGKGGRGNARFKSPTNQAPRIADKGEEGEELYLRLELKLLADVGLVGFPNAGKSTLLSVLTRAKPKIAPYPFTTLSPNLGVVKGEKENSFVIADIPGLIEDAHKGEGLGVDFLKHIERTRLILHLVDLSDETAPPLKRYLSIRKELELFNRMLLEKPTIVVGTKIDLSYDKEKEKELVDYLEKESIPYHRISAVARKGVNSLLKKVWSYFKDE